MNRVSLLLSKHTSRCNKMHLAAAWGVLWRWQGEGPMPNGVMRSRMAFQINGEWREAKSWDEDVRTKLIENKE